MDGERESSEFMVSSHLDDDMSKKGVKNYFSL